MDVQKYITDLRVVRPLILAVASFGLLLSSSSSGEGTGERAADRSGAEQGDTTMSGKVIKSDAEWRARLTAEQFRILREKGTERAFSGVFDEFFEDGVYTCAGCGAVLFTSETKYNSGCGWPAFFDAAGSAAVDTQSDSSYGMNRTEILCSRCGGHLGHVFEDGPKPTGLRYCVNSAALKFKSSTESDSSGEQK